MAASLAVLLLNYKRPQNIGRIVQAARTGLPEAPILLLDQAETDALRRRNDIPWTELWYRRAAQNKGAGARVPLAAQLPFDRYIAIDDDIFFTPAQVAELAAALAAEPDRAHGVAGQRIEVHEGQVRLQDFISGVDAAVSVLNMAYAFTRTQAQGAIALAARLGWPRWDEIGPLDDIFLSCAAAKPAACHNLGSVETCPSADDPSVAVWMTKGFRELRLEAVQRLVAGREVGVFMPAPR